MPLLLFAKGKEWHGVARSGMLATETGAQATQQQVLDSNNTLVKPETYAFKCVEQYNDIRWLSVCSLWNARMVFTCKAQPLTLVWSDKRCLSNLHGDHTWQWEFWAEVTQRNTTVLRQICSRNTDDRLERSLCIYSCRRDSQHHWCIVKSVISQEIAVSCAREANCQANCNLRTFSWFLDRCSFKLSSLLLPLLALCPNILKENWTGDRSIVCL